MTIKIQNKATFHLVSCTWGIIMTLIGGIAALGLLITGHKPKQYGYCIHFEVGKNWGGVNLGLFFITGKGASDSTKNHEHGHGIQNVILGPLFPFLVALPSLARAGMRNYGTRKGKTIFSIILYAAVILVSAGLIVLAVFTQPWVFVFPIFLSVYGTILFCWLMFVEIPKYDALGYTPYDSVWFEGEATKLGNEFMTFHKYGV